MSGPAQADGNAPDPHGVPVVREVQIVNKKGLHARASAKFVQTAERFDAAITVTRGARNRRRHLDHGPDDAGRRPRHHHHRPGHRQGGRGGARRARALVANGFGEED